MANVCKKNEIKQGEILLTENNNLMSLIPKSAKYFLESKKKRGIARK